MKHILTLTFIAVLFSACNNATPHQKTGNAITHIYPTVSYLDIQLDSAGRLPSNPYIAAFENGNKKIVFCAVNHLTDDTDIDNPMFSKIEEEFFIDTLSVQTGF